MSVLNSIYLTDFRHIRPRFEKTQAETLAWLLNAYQASQTELTGERLEKLLRRVSCSPAQIGTRGHEFPMESVISGTEARTLLFRDAAAEIFEKIYDRTSAPPDDVIHVTCTGYVSPSPAQLLVEKRGWGRETTVTHAYHMGCYAAFPAVRLAEGFLRSKSARVDIIHTEMCSLHVRPDVPSPEQMVVQSLFADGNIRYSAQLDRVSPGFEVLAVHEEIVPKTMDAMTWLTGDQGMKMTLSKDVPALVASDLSGFVERLLLKGRLELDPRTIFAVHPGGPKIIDLVSESLGLKPSQVAHSRDVLFSYGNMSSATVPHIWERILKDQSVPIETPVLSMAFGPGLTLCGSLMKKC